MNTQNQKSNENIRTRLETAKYILDLSYKLISHYDSKTNQLLMLIGFDFAILTVILTFVFEKVAGLNLYLKVAIIFLNVIDFSLICVSLELIRRALIPHVNPVVKKEKPKNGLIYFMDIKNYLGEDEYVNILVGEQKVTSSKAYDDDDTYSFEKCIIEDAGRDIYAHAEILQLKTKYVKYAFNISVITSILCVITVLFILILFVLGA